jgi:hypothetical protein
MAPTRPSSRDADVFPASQPQHAIEHVNGFLHLVARRSSVWQRNPSPINRFHRSSWPDVPVTRPGGFRGQSPQTLIGRRHLSPWRAPLGERIAFL